MGFTELFLIAMGLAMDAFAVALCKGLNMRSLNMKNGVIIALFFGGFQAFMPLLGWALGKQFEQYIVRFDHWISFILLATIGSKMIGDAFGQAKEESCDDRLDIKELFVLAVATSIDALAVGITFAFLQTAILPAIGMIGTVTFALSLTGVAIGNRFGLRLKNKAEIAGGIVLILIGFKILLGHLGML